MQIAREEREALLEGLLSGRFPDAAGRFGPFGGRYVPETLMAAVTRLEEGVRTVLRSAEFEAHLAAELRDWIGRPTALTPAPTLGRR